MGTYGRRYGQHFIIGQLDVALPLSRGRRCRLYTAVKALSDFCCALQINVPTGKDSLSMTQKYPDGEKVISPGTVIVSAGGEVSDVKKVVSPVLVNNEKTTLYHIDFSFDALKLGRLCLCTVIR